MNRRDKQLLLTSKKLRALVPPFYSFRKEKKERGFNNLINLLCYYTELLFEFIY